MSERRVYLVQCLCPQRHAIAASPYEGLGSPDEQAKHVELVRDRLDEHIREEKIDPWCGLCGARRETWRFEVGRTPWSTMAEAEPHLNRSAALQALTREVFGSKRAQKANMN